MTFHSDLDVTIEDLEDELAREEKRLASKERAPYEGRVAEPYEWKRSLESLRVRVSTLRGEHRLLLALRNEQAGGRSE